MLRAYQLANTGTGHRTAVMDEAETLGIYEPETIRTRFGDALELPVTRDEFLALDLPRRTISRR